MHLSPKEIDKLLLLSLGDIAERRLKKGLKLNYPEAVAYITSAALEGLFAFYRFCICLPTLLR